MNGGYNGATNQEVVYYYVTVGPSKTSSAAFKIVAQLVEEARFPPRPESRAAGR